MKCLKTCNFREYYNNQMEKPLFKDHPKNQIEKPLFKDHPKNQMEKPLFKDLPKNQMSGWSLVVVSHCSGLLSGWPFIW